MLQWLLNAFGGRMYGPNELVASVSGQSSHTRSNSECQPHHSWLRCGVVNGQPLDWSWTMASLRLLNDIIANCGSGHKLNPMGCLLSLRKVFVILSCEPTKNRTTGDLKETSGKLLQFYEDFRGLGSGALHAMKRPKSCAWGAMKVVTWVKLKAMMCF